MKNLTDLRKSVETGVDPQLKYIVFEQVQNIQPPWSRINQLPPWSCSDQMNDVFSFYTLTVL